MPTSGKPAVSKVEYKAYDLRFGHWGKQQKEKLRDVQGESGVG